MVKLKSVVPSGRRPQRRYPHMSEDHSEKESDADIDEESVTNPEANASDETQPDGTTSTQSEPEPSQKSPSPESDGQSSQDQSGPTGTDRDGPTVNMGMMYGGVEVTGASDDELDDVTEAATELMSNLAEEFKGIQSAMDDQGDGGDGGNHYCQ